MTVAEAQVSHSLQVRTVKLEQASKSQQGPPWHNRVDASIDYSDHQLEAARRSHSQITGHKSTELPGKPESFQCNFKQTTLKQKGPGYWNTRAQSAFENMTSQLPCRSRLISELAPFFIELRAERSSASGCLLVFVRFGYSAASNTFGLVTSRSPRRLGDPEITPELTGLSRVEAEATTKQKSCSGPWIQVTQALPGRCARLLLSRSQATRSTARQSSWSAAFCVNVGTQLGDVIPLDKLEKAPTVRRTLTTGTEQEAVEAHT
jgi:hypothetical protein